jgi:hypothetical protein
VSSSGAENCDHPRGFNLAVAEILKFFQKLEMSATRKRVYRYECRYLYSGENGSVKKFKKAAACMSRDHLI